MYGHIFEFQDHSSTKPFKLLSGLMNKNIATYTHEYAVIVKIHQM